MPRSSQRAQSIRSLTELLRLHIKKRAFESLLDSSEDEKTSSDKSEVEELVAALITIKKKRYLAKRTRLERPPDITDYLFRLDTDRFEQEFRMSQDSFFNLVAMIEGHPVFHNNLNVPQRPVQDQLCVALRRMGMFGNGASVGILARFFRISEGSVILYCSRVIEAILSLEKKHISWPNAQRREGIARQIGKTTVFKSCVGFIDGTLIPLDEKPSIDPQDYYSRKSTYGVATLIVCDDKKRIIYYLTGWPGCSHDTRLWENCELHQQESRLFSPGQYLIGDSGFPMESNLVPAFKKPPHGSIPRLKKKFNQHLASLRVCNEHCIGILKGRFQSLRGLRKELTSVETMDKVTQWVGACVILHNYLLHDESPSYVVATEETRLNMDNDDSPRRGIHSAGYKLRETVFSGVLRHLGIKET